MTEQSFGTHHFKEINECLKEMNVLLLSSFWIYFCLVPPPAYFWRRLGLLPAWLLGPRLGLGVIIRVHEGCACVVGNGF